MSLFERWPVARRVAVTTKTDRTFRGLLWSRTREHLVLKQAVLLGKDGSEQALDGELVIERANVDVIQVLG